MRRDDTQACDASSPDQEQVRFLDMWERCVEEENARFERSAQMFRGVGQGKWNKPMLF